jgi:phage-related protein
VENASQQAISGLDTATTQLTDSIEQLGKPSTSDGTKARNAVEKLSNELSGDVENIKNELTNLPSDAAWIASSFAQIGSDVQKAISQVRSTATTLRGLSPTAKLKKAFQSSSECQSLNAL